MMLVVGGGTPNDVYAVLLRCAAVTHVLQRADDEETEQQPQAVNDYCQTGDADDKVMEFKGIGTLSDVQKDAGSCYQHEADNQPENLLAETRGRNVNVRHSVKLMEN